MRQRDLIERGKERLKYLRRSAHGQESALAFDCFERKESFSFKILFGVALLRCISVGPEFPFILPGILYNVVRD